MKKLFTILLLVITLFISNNAKSQNDVGVISIDSLTNSCSHSATETITVKVKNFGMLTISSGDTIPMTFQLNTNATEYDSLILTSDFNAGDTIVFTYSFTEDLSSAGTYNLYASTNLTGDITSTNNIDTLTISTYGNPTIMLNDTDICNGQSAILTANGGNTYLWNTTDTTATISVTPTSTTTYYVTVTDTNYCSATDSVTVTLHNVTVGFTGGTQVCEGNSINITATGGTSYLWNTTDTTATISVTPTDTTTYSVIVTDSIGCSATDSITINTISTNFTFPSDTFVCAGDSINLTANGGTSYLWNTTDTTATISVTPTDTTTYYVTITDANSCSGTDSVTVNYNSIPIITTSFTDTTICANYTIMCTASGADTYVWSNGTTAASANLASSTNTTYTVTGTKNNCSATTSVNVNVTSSPDINLEEEYDLHTNNVIALSVTSGYTYLWNTGETTNTIFVYGDSLGVGTYNYWVKATGSNGCITTDSTIINISWGLGFNDNDITKVNIYPNPTTNYLIISTNFDYFKYQLIDINGNIIKNCIINSNVAKIDFTQYKKGTYFIKITNNNKTYINKILNK